MSGCHASPCWRPRRLAGGAALSVLLHALALGALAPGAAPPPLSSAVAAPERITTLWLLRAPMPGVTVASRSRPMPDARSHRTPRDHAARRVTAVAFARPASAPRPISPRATAATATETAAATSTGPVHGLAFAVPRLRVGLAPAMGPATTTAGAAGAPTPSPRPSPPRPPPSWLVEPMQQAALHEFGQRLQQHLWALARPADTQPGHCRLASDDAGALVCDRPALQAVVAADAPALAGLMRAYRGAAAPDATVALAYAQQRFRIELR
jgi:hypothetical protein